MSDVMEVLTSRPLSPIPARAGVGLKAPHYKSILEDAPSGLWFEVHPENYMGAGGAPHYFLSRIRERYPLSLHGVGLSLGGEDRLDRDHLRRLAALVREYRPGLVSEHLAWCRHDGAFLNDLLPVAYDDAALERLVDHVSEAQDHLARRLLIENPSTYLRHTQSHIDEVEFLARIAERTGCGLLLDVNNVLVSAVNHGFSADDYLARFPMQHVGEIHVAGHDVQTDDGGRTLLVDTHDRPVSVAVWDMLERALALAGPLPVLVERDADIPPWADLLAESRAAQAVIDAATANRESRHAPAAV